VAAGLHGRLVERGGDDAVDPPLPGQPAGFHHEPVRAVAGNRAELTDRHVGQRSTGLDDLDSARVVGGAPRIGDHPHRLGVQPDPRGPDSYGVGVADDHWYADLAQVGVL
jgi:hypothetical protein